MNVFRSSQITALATLTALTTLTVLCAAGARPAHAQGVTPVFISATGAAGNVTYTYQITANSDTRVASGDLFTLYDFAGLLTGGANTPVFTPGQVGPNYAISIQNLGINPAGTIALGGDDSAKPNVTLTYSGTTFVNVTSNSQLLGTLTLHSTFFSSVGATAYAASATKNSNASASGNQGYVTGPSASATAPEPGSGAMLIGMGLSAAAFVRRRARRS